MPRIPPQQEISLSAMSGTQLYNYRRALVRHLSDKRCATDGPRYQEQRDRLAEVLACREPVVLFTQTASARSMRLAAKLG
jgi:hypothetical protein